MKEVSFGPGKILLCRNKKGELSAVGSKCTHYGARLVTGTYGGGDHVRCPWHGACFNTKTGDIEDYPAMAALPVFQVRVSNDEIIVRANVKDVQCGRQSTPLFTQVNDSPLFVIVGGGAAGSSCAETLRKANFTGRIVVVSKENVLPYDRPKLTKAKSIKPENILLQPKQFWDDIKVEYLLGTHATEVDARSKIVTLNTGEVLHYSACLIATGGKPRKLPLPNLDEAKNVFYLRSIEDCMSIQDRVDQKRVLVIGSSFIGMEISATILDKVSSVSIVSMDAVPMERVLGPQIGEALKKLQESKGIQFYLKKNIQSTNINDAGDITDVLLDSGESLSCDIVIIGVGVVPNTDFVKGLELDPNDHSIVCDKYMKAFDSLYVAGDIAKFPLKLLDDELVRIEHWGMAQTLGSTAAWNMAGIEKPLESVPFFWTSMFGKSVRYAGHARHFDQVIFDMPPDGLEPSGMKFIACYCDKNRVLAVASMGSDPAASIACELMCTNKMPDVNTIQDTIKKGDSLISFFSSLL
ncbi:apoptosis-inducing factor 3-like [Schistocerca gregaria]|uniref:apoptosis-inducing factor 3-like n=1 Tax=Schistocerca gregaria TaxID=7010 RepID=UPI00211EA1DA|nr:apoptosis-inducing factor 3-like [Schistocerca gregaria]